MIISILQHFNVHQLTRQQRMSNILCIVKCGDKTSNPTRDCENTSMQKLSLSKTNGLDFLSSYYIKTTETHKTLQVQCLVQESKLQITRLRFTPLDLAETSYSSRLEEVARVSRLSNQSVQYMS